MSTRARASGSPTPQRTAPTQLWAVGEPVDDIYTDLGEAADTLNMSRKPTQALAEASVIASVAIELSMGAHDPLDRQRRARAVIYADNAGQPGARVAVSQWRKTSTLPIGSILPAQFSFSPMPTLPAGGYHIGLEIDAQMEQGIRLGFATGGGSHDEILTSTNPVTTWAAVPLPGIIGNSGNGYTP